MGKKTKAVPVERDVARLIHDDLDGNNLVVRVYDHIPEFYVDSGLVAADVAGKSAGLMVTISGSDERAYMVIGALRRDRTAGTDVTDIDPVAIVYGVDSAEMPASGVQAFHQGFPGRTEVLNNTVTELSGCNGYVEYPFETAPQRYQEATHHMARLFDRQFGRKKGQ
jgi:hypothetical protein